MLEGFAQKLAGTGSSGYVIQSDVKMPSNVSDSDLFPSMKEVPKEPEGPTDMMFYLVRCLVGQFLKRSTDGQTTFDGAWNGGTTSVVELTTKEKAIDDLNAVIQRRFLQYCDPSIPWHLMCIHLGEVIIFMLRFVSRSTATSSMDLAQQEEDPLFDLALQVSTSQNLAYTMKEMQGFMWHVNLHFQWKAIIYILTKLRYRTEGPQVEKAWKEVEKTFEYHPSFEKDLSIRALPVAMSNLALKAWDARVKARGQPAGGEPYFIRHIRSRRTQTRSPSSRQELSEVADTVPLPIAAPHHGNPIINDNFLSEVAAPEPFEWNTTEINAGLGLTPNIPDTVPLDFPEQMDWSAWDSLLVDFQTHDTDNYPMDFSAFNLEALSS